MSFLCLIATLAASAMSAPGDYVWPLTLDPQLTSSFAEYRPGRFHAGIDLRTSGVGRDVYAAGDGYVSRVRCSPYGYGKAVYLQLADGNIAIYAHLSDYYPELKAFVQQEQHRQERYAVDVYLKPSQFPITKGQLLAKSGQTGIGAPHLHFEMRDAAHEPVNPRLLGFDWPDNASPKIRQVLVAPKGLDGRVEGDILPIVLPVIQDESGSLRTRPVHATGLISLGADVVDPGSGGYNLGVHQLRLLDGTSEVFRMQHDRMSYTNHRNGAVSYHPQMMHEGRFLLTWRWPGNQSYSYSVSPNDGWAAITPETRELSIEAVDFYGNSTRVIVPIIPEMIQPSAAPASRSVEMDLVGPALMLSARLGSDAEISPVLEVAGGKAQDFKSLGNGRYRTLFVPEQSGRYTLTVQHPDLSAYSRDVVVFIQGQRKQTFTLGDVQLTAGPETPYGALFLRAWTVGSPPAHSMAAQSAAYQIWPGDAPIFDPVTISIPLNDGISGKRNIHVYRYRGSYWSREDTTFRGNRAEVKTRTAGIFMAMEDNTPPVLSSVLPAEGYSAQSARPVLQAKVSDSGSGIAGYTITCGNRWLIAAYDPEHNEVVWDRDEDLPSGPQTITFTLTDEAGNTKVLSRNIVIP